MPEVVNIAYSPSYEQIMEELSMFKISFHES